MNLSLKDLEPYIGKRGRISEIFNRQRNLSLKMIQKLHFNLNIPLESLIEKPAKMRINPVRNNRVKKSVSRVLKQVDD